MGDRLGIHSAVDLFFSSHFLLVCVVVVVVVVVVWAELSNIKWSFIWAELNNSRVGLVLG